MQGGRKPALNSSGKRGWRMRQGPRMGQDREEDGAKTAARPESLSLLSCGGGNAGEVTCGGNDVLNPEMYVTPDRGGCRSVPEQANILTQPRPQGRRNANCSGETAYPAPAPGSDVCEL